MRDRWIKNMLCVPLLLSLLLTPVLAAEGALPDGFSGVDSVTLEADSGLPWRTPTEDDLTAFGTLTDETHQAVYLAGNSGTSEKNVSNLAVTVSEPGKLTLDYRVSCYPSINFMLAYSFGTQITLENYGTAAANSSSDVRTAFCGNQEWTSLSLDITEDMLTDGTLTIYFAYVRNGAQDAHDWATTWERPDCLNYAAIANVSYASGSRTDLIYYEDGYNTTMGTVSAYISETVTNEEGKKEVIVTSVDLTAGVDVGQTLTLRAQAGSGCRFYGWVRNYMSSNGNLLHSFEGGGSDLTVSVDETSTYTPMFAAEGAYTLRKGSAFYTVNTSLSEVLAGAKRGDIVELLADTELTENVSIPSGVTLYVPFRADWGKEERTGAYHLSGGSANISDTSKAHVTLTVPEGVTLTISGTLVSGAVMSCSDHYLQGHTSGAYGRIENNGTILVSGTGAFTTWGITDGTGTVLAESGATVKEPFIVCDFSGGSNTSSLYGDGQIPFKRFAMQNIQCRLQLERGSTLMGLCSLYALGGYNEAEVSVVGAENAIFQPNDTAVTTGGQDIMLERTYDPDGALTGSGLPTGTAGIGISVWHVSGGLTFQSMTMSLFDFVTLSTEDVDFPIPYNMQFVLANGKYVIPGRLKLMPGAKVTVAQDASLEISGGGRLLVLDGLTQGKMSSKNYPSGEALANSGLSQSGTLIVNGSLKVAAGATLGGVVQTTGETGMLIVEEGAFLSNSGDLESLDPALGLTAQTGYQENDWVQQDGGLGTYSDNTTWFNLPARICVAGTDEDGNPSYTLAPLTPGTYRAAGGDSFTLDSYTVRWCSNGTGNGTAIDTASFLPNREMTLATVAINQAMTGVWTSSTAELEVTATTPYGESSAVNVTVLTETTADTSQYSLTVNVENKDGTELTRTYVHLVKYVPKGAQEAVRADGTDGSYLIPIDAGSVTVESAMLGDVMADSYIDNKDLILLRRGVADTNVFSDLQTLTADLYSDGEINNKDLITIRKQIA